jgi:FlaA1/EpsC-like NDP-sugar epimerase
MPHLRLFIRSIFSLSRFSKRLLFLCVDISTCLLTVWLAFYLRLGLVLQIGGVVFVAMIYSVSLAIPVFIYTGLYRSILRHSGFPLLFVIVRSIFIYGFIYSLIFTFYGIPGIPRTIGLIQPLLLLIFIVASRVLIRFLYNRYYIKINNILLSNVFIYGCGNSGRQLAVSLENSSKMRVVGFLDDDLQLQGQLLNGLHIYSPKQLKYLIKKFNVSVILIALNSVTRFQRSLILNKLSVFNIAVRLLPDVEDIASGKITINDIREIDIEDVLSREVVSSDQRLITQNIFAKVVLVTGAGGSIGSELCRQIIKSKPNILLLYELNEYSLYKLYSELIDINDNLNSDNEFKTNDYLNSKLNGNLIFKTRIIPLIGSVCDRARVCDVMNLWKPNTVYHTAAYKHVPIVEHNPIEGLRNNIWGTLVCAEEAAKSKVENFVLISTDKAVRPTNIMGASKRIAEMVLQAISDNEIKFNKSLGCKYDTIFSIVRFGNVLGSSGSVVPLFREQINKGGPITLTHKDITRYFMTIPEAAQLVIQAGAMGSGGDVFVLDMGQPVRIYDLACNLVKLSGLTIKDELNPDGDIEISITGLRPGEKLYEELLIGNNPKATDHPLIMKANEEFIEWNKLESKLNDLNLLMNSRNISSIVSLLGELVKGYENNSIVDWIYLAKNNKVVSTEN